MGVNSVDDVLVCQEGPSSLQQSPRSDSASSSVSSQHLQLPVGVTCSKSSVMMMDGGGGRQLSDVERVPSSTCSTGGCCQWCVTESSTSIGTTINNAASSCSCSINDLPFSSEAVPFVPDDRYGNGCCYRGGSYDDQQDYAAFKPPSQHEPNQPYLRQVSRPYPVPGVRRRSRSNNRSRYGSGNQRSSGNPFKGKRGSGGGGGGYAGDYSRQQGPPMPMPPQMGYPYPYPFWPSPPPGDCMMMMPPGYPGFRRMPPPMGRDFGYYDPMGSFPPPGYRRFPRMPPPPPMLPAMHYGRTPYGGGGGGGGGSRHCGGPRQQFTPNGGPASKGLKRKFTELDRNSGGGTYHGGDTNRYDEPVPLPNEPTQLLNVHQASPRSDFLGTARTEAEDVATAAAADKRDDGLRVPPDLLQPLYCKLCDTRLNGTLQASAHYEGKNHKKKERQYLEKVRKELGLKTVPPAQQAASGGSAARKVGSGDRKRRDKLKARGRLTAGASPAKAAVTASAEPADLLA